MLNGHTDTVTLSAYDGKIDQPLSDVGDPYLSAHLRIPQIPSL